MKKKLLSIFLSLAMVITMMPAMALTAFATDNISQTAVVMLKATTSGNNAVKLSWTKADTATKYVVYGNKCGKSFKKLATVKSNKYTVKKIGKTKLAAHKFYKFKVVAYNGSTKLATSKAIHFITGKTSGKYANASKITATTAKLTLEVGQTAKVGATVKVYKNKKHISSDHGSKLRYVSDNKAVATVNSNGTVKAVSEGTATIYIQDVGGLYCKTIVTVEDNRDKEAFEQYKQEVIAKCEALSKLTDTKGIKTMIADAKSSIESLTYDKTLTLEENKAAVDAIYTNLVEKVKTQRIKQGLTLAALTAITGIIFHEIITPDPEPTPEIKTIADVIKLVDNFPTTSDKGWGHSTAVGYKMYYTNNGLMVYAGRDSKPIAGGYEPVVEVSGGYKYQSESKSKSVIFNVVNGKLTSIKIEGFNDVHLATDCDGTYVPPTPVVHVTSVSLEMAELTITVGDPDVTLTTTVLPDNATNKAVTWTSSNTDVATVDNEGNVHAVAAGEATITVTTEDGNKTATCEVTVTAPPATTYTVTFDLNGITGTAPEAQTIVSGEKVTKPEDPTDTIHTFGGWYKTKDATTGMLSDPWNFDTNVVTENITLYAQWTRTLESIIATYEDFPRDDSFTPPENAWIKTGDSGRKAYSTEFTICFQDGSDYMTYGAVSLYQNFIRVGDSYVDYSGYRKITCNMTEGVLASITAEGVDLSYPQLDGTYAPPAATPTFKAVYNTKDGANTLTFYYDAVDHSGDNITVYDNLTPSASSSGWSYNNIRSNIKQVVIDSSVAKYDGLTATGYMFHNMSNATGISGVEYLDVSKVQNMSYMFSNFGSKSTSLTDVPNVKDWNTANAITMTSMFKNFGSGSTSLTAVPDVSKWSTAKVTNMSEMFCGFGSQSTLLTAVPDVSKWSTANVTNMSGMFNSFAKSSTSLAAVPDVSDVSKWNTANVKNMSSLFAQYGYKSMVLNAVPDVSNWKTDKVTNMKFMFQDYGFSSTYLAQTPNMNEWNTGNVTNMEKMFNNYGYNSTALNFTLDLSGWSVANVTDYTYMFSSAGKETSTWSVTIPGLTGTKANDVTHWYVGDGTDTEKYIEPASGRQFTLAKSIADILPDDFPTTDNISNVPEGAWTTTNGNKCYLCTSEGLCFKPEEKDPAAVKTSSLVTKNGSDYVYNEASCTIKFTISEDKLTSITFTHKNEVVANYDGTYAPAAPVVKAPGLYQDGVLVCTWSELIGTKITLSGTKITNCNRNNPPIGELVIDSSITEIGYGAFADLYGLQSVTIPNGVTIGEGAFYGCVTLSNITFNGTKEQWNAITKGVNWSSGISATGVQCSDGFVDFHIIK